MADSSTPPPNTYGDPFADRPHHLQFEEPPRPFQSPDRPDTLRTYQSTTSLTLGDSENYDDDEYVEKQPLNAGQGFAGGFYPPACVCLPKSCPSH
jgi:chitin synthase